MPWRKLFLDNLGWKFLALALAVLIWSGAQELEVQPTITSPLGSLVSRTFDEVPVRVVSLPGTLGPVRVNPPTVRVEVLGEMPRIQRLRTSDLLVLVDLGEVSDAGRVDVRLPTGIRLVKIDPDRVIMTPLSAN